MAIRSSPLCCITDGRRYEGFWEKSKKHGHGIYYFESDKCLYNGDWKDGHRSGQGIYPFSSNSIPSTWILNSSNFPCSVLVSSRYHGVGWWFKVHRLVERWQEAGGARRDVWTWWYCEEKWLASSKALRQLLRWRREHMGDQVQDGHQQKTPWSSAQTKARGQATLPHKRRPGAWPRRIYLRLCIAFFTCFLVL